MKRKVRNTIVHEVLERSHRIIVHKGDGTTDAGKWAALAEVANHGKYYAITGESPFPQGVFTCAGVNYQVLS